MTIAFGKALGPGLVALAVLSLAACTTSSPRSKGSARTTQAETARAQPAPRASAPRTAPVTPVTATAIPSEGSTASGAVYVARPAAVGQVLHVVARGDTVYAISRRYGVPVRSIIDHNGLRPPFPLKVGQRLQIPLPRRHVVARKETVYGISRRYGVPLRGVIDANGLKPPYSLRIGQQLLIPVQRDHVGQRLVLPDSRPPDPVSAQPKAPPAGKTLLAVRPARAAPVAVPQPPPRAGNKFHWPVEGRVILGYGPKANGLHNDGINIKAPRGAPVRAAENGVVAYAGNELRGFGNLVLIKHAGGWVTAYAHTDQVAVRRGDKVRRGQIIGRVGSTGNVASPQLHFEVRKGTQAVDPTRLLTRQTAGG